MDIKEAMKLRHSVRKYTDKPIEPEKQRKISEKIDWANRESGLNIQLITDEPKAFGGMMARYGKFSGISNYIAMIGEKREDLSERCGYYGEMIVLLAQQLGLNTCWVGLNFRKIPDALKINKNEKLVLVISLGYGATQGVESKSKQPTKVSDVTESCPSWYRNGIDAALLAPTAINQQKFKFKRDGSRVSLKAGLGFYSKVDLGIVKCHFEIGAGTENFIWNK